jgi:hypothetical protein
MFGGERFEPIIGKISLARDMKSALQEAEDAEDEEGGGAGDAGVGPDGRKRIMSEEEKRKKADKDAKKKEERLKAREKRIDALVENLVRKLSIFTESATGPNDADVTRSFKTICQLEAE